MIDIPPYGFFTSRALDKLTRAAEGSFNELHCSILIQERMSATGRKLEAFARSAVDVNIVDNQGPIWVHSNTAPLVVDKKFSGFIQI